MNTTDSHGSQNPELAAQGKETLGEYLVRVREKKNISLKTIAQNTRINYTLLKALEDNQLEQLPHRTYVRGFVMAYAKEIGAREDVCMELLGKSYVGDHLNNKKESSLQVKTLLDSDKAARPAPVKKDPLSIKPVYKTAAATATPASGKKTGADLLSPRNLLLGAFGLFGLVALFIVMANSRKEDSMVESVSVKNEVAPVEQEAPVPQVLGAAVPEEAPKPAAEVKPAPAPVVKESVKEVIAPQANLETNPEKKAQDRQLERSINEVKTAQKKPMTPATSSPVTLSTSTNASVAPGAAPALPFNISSAPNLSSSPVLSPSLAPAPPVQATVAQAPAPAAPAPSVAQAIAQAKQQISAPVTPTPETTAKKDRVNEGVPSSTDEFTPKQFSTPLYTLDNKAKELKDDEIFPTKNRVSGSDGTQNLFIHATNGDTWVTYKSGENPVKSFVLRQGRSVFIRDKEIRLFMGNINAAKIFLNNNLVKVVAPSSVKSLVFPQENSSKYNLPLFVFDKQSGQTFATEDFLRRPAQTIPEKAKP